jgi:hypothetical protein
MLEMCIQTIVNLHSTKFHVNPFSQWQVASCGKICQSINVYFWHCTCTHKCTEGIGQKIILAKTEWRRKSGVNGGLEFKLSLYNAVKVKSKHYLNLGYDPR